MESYTMRTYLVILFVMFSTGSYAAAHKWTDANGQVHYSDQVAPVHAKAVQTIGPDTPDAPIQAAASGVTPATKAAAEKDPAKEAAAKKAAAAKAEQEAAIKAQNQTNCAAAKQNLANLRADTRIMTVDPVTGERNFMDDAQRQKGVDEAQQQISKFCQ